MANDKELIRWRYGPRATTPWAAAATRCSQVPSWLYTM